MTADFTALLPTIIVAIIGWLIRQAFKSFEDKLTTVAATVERLDERMNAQERRLSVTHAVLREKGVIS